jgi:hypothetical protein
MLVASFRFFFRVAKRFGAALIGKVTTQAPGKRFRRPSSINRICFLQSLIQPVPLILEDVANQGADLANIGVVDGN